MGLASGLTGTNAAEGEEHSRVVQRGGVVRSEMNLEYRLPNRGHVNRKESTRGLPEADSLELLRGLTTHSFKMCEGKKDKVPLKLSTSQTHEEDQEEREKDL